MRRKSLIRRLLPWIIAIALIAALVVFVGIPLYSQKEEINEYPPTVSYYEGDGKEMRSGGDRDPVSQSPLGPYKDVEFCN